MLQETISVDEPLHTILKYIAVAIQSHVMLYSMFESLHNLCLSHVTLVRETISVDEPLHAIFPKYVAYRHMLCCIPHLSFCVINSYPMYEYALREVRGGS